MKLKNQELKKVGNGYGFYVKKTYIADSILKEGKRYNLDVKEVESTTRETLIKNQNKKNVNAKSKKTI